MSPEMDRFNDFDESVASKPNRRKKLEPKTHSPVVGPLPPSGVHKVSRKERDRLLKEKIAEFLKKSG